MAGALTGRELADLGVARLRRPRGVVNWNEAIAFVSGSASAPSIPIGCRAKLNGSTRLARAPYPTLLGDSLSEACRSRTCKLSDWISETTPLVDSIKRVRPHDMLGNASDGPRVLGEATALHPTNGGPWSIPTVVNLCGAAALGATSLGGGFCVRNWSAPSNRTADLGFGGQAVP